MRIIQKFWAVMALWIIWEGALFADQSKRLSLSEFIQMASEKDSEFEAILIEELALRYRKDLVLPAKDLVLSTKALYDLILNQDRNEGEGEIALSSAFSLYGNECVF